jgi:peptidoglycan/xylan/chitin deacetylase (PgdA/CDA1 family)
MPICQYRVLYRVIRLSISVVFLGYLSFRRGLLQLLGGAVPATCIVLYYHSVPSKCRLAFGRQMEIVTRLTRPIKINGQANLLPGIRYAAVTFDDGFEDAVENAVPELVRRNIPALFFVTTDVLGQLATWWPRSEPERNRRIVTSEKLQQLPGEWISIGAHTLTHPRLSELAEADARREILESRRRLEVLVGSKIDTLSFPYGDFNDRLIGWCREAGYKRVFTTQAKDAFGYSNEFVVGRVKAEPTDWKLEFEIKLLGGYSWMPWASTLKRRCVALPLVNRFTSLGASARRTTTANGYARKTAVRR